MFTQEEWKIIFTNWLKSKKAYELFDQYTSSYGFGKIDTNTYLLHESPRRFVINAFAWSSEKLPSPYYWFELHHEWCQLYDDPSKCQKYLFSQQSINIF